MSGGRVDVDGAGRGQGDVGQMARTESMVRVLRRALAGSTALVGIVVRPAAAVGALHVASSPTSVRERAARLLALAIEPAASLLARLTGAAARRLMRVGPVARLRRRWRAAAVAGAMAAMGLAGTPATAQTYTWVGGNAGTTTTDYNTDTNWLNAAALPPSATPKSPGQSALFNNLGGTIFLNVGVSAAVNPDAWTFDTNSKSYVISGAQVTFNTTGITDNAVAGTTISIGNVLAGGATAGVTQAGAGTLALTGVNTYGGNTTISGGGTVQANSTDALGAANNRLVFDGGTLQATGTITSPATRGVTMTGAGTIDTNGKPVSIAGQITGAGGLTKIGAGTLTLTGANTTYTGTTTISAGAVNVQTGTALGTGTVADNATLQLQGGITVANTMNLGGLLQSVSAGDSYTGPITLTADSTIQSDTGLLTVGNTINGAHGLTLQGAGNGTTTGAIGGGTNLTTLTVAGTGTWTLSGATNTFTGVVSVDTGTLSLSANDTLTSAGVTNGATFTNAGTVASGVTNNGTFGTTGTVSGAVVNNATATASGQINNTVTNAANATFAVTGTLTGITSLANDGTFTLGGNSTTVGALTSAGTTGVVQNGSATTAATLTVNQAGNTTYAGILQNGAAAALALTKTGAGTLTLTGTSTYTGQTTVGDGTNNAGQLVAASNGALGTGNVVVNTLGTLGLQGGATVNNALSLDGTGSGAANGALESLSGANTYSGAITLAGASRIDVDAGSLALSGGINGATAGQNLTLGSLATGVDGTESGVIGANVGTLTKDGAGTWTLTRANAYAGQTTVSAGILNIQNGAALGAAAAGTTVQIGGTLQVQGGITVTGEALTLSGAGSTGANGALQSVSDGNVYSGAITLVGDSRIDSDIGTLTLNSAAAIGGNGGLTLGGNGNGIVASAIATGGNTLTKDGTGTWVLTGANSYTGQTTVTAGTLQVGAGGTTGQIGQAGAVYSNVAVNPGGVLNFARADTAAAGGYVYGGVVTGVGTVNQNGTGLLNLTGANSAANGQFTGTANVNAGILAINGTFGDTANNAATVEVNNGGTLHGSGTIAGSVVVNGGGTVSAGNSPGTMTVTRDYTLTNGSDSLFELGTSGVVGGPTNDLIVVGRNLTLAGTLMLDDDADQPLASGSYRLYNYGGTVSGMFGAVDAAPGSTARVYTTIPGQVNVQINNGGQVVQYWDDNDQTGAIPGAQGGSGTWNSTNTNWTSDPNSQINDSWQRGVGVFGTTGGAVDLQGTQSFQGLQFTAGGYTISTDPNTGGALNVTGDPFTTPTQSFVNVGAGLTATILSNITGGANIGLRTSGAGTLVFGGVASYGGLTSVNTGTFVNDGTIMSGVAVAAGAVYDNAGTTGGGLTNAGTVNASGGAINGAVVNDAQFNVTGRVTGNGSFTNAPGATLLVTAAGDDAIGGGLTNGGIVDVAGGTLSTVAGLTNDATVNAAGAVGGPVTNAAQFNVTGRLVGDATFANARGAILNVGANSYTGLTTVGNAGLVSVRGGTLGATAIDNAAGGLIASTGTLATTAGLTNAGTVDASGVVSGPVTNDAQFNVTGPLAGNSTFANAQGATLAVGGNSYTGITTLTNAGTVTVTGGTLSAGAIDNSGTVSWAGTLRTSAGFTNTGTANASGVVGGPVFNDAGGQFNVTGTLVGDSAFSNAQGGTLTVGANAYTGTTTLTNAGAVAVGAGGTLGADSIANANTGVITTSGTVATAAGLTNAGTVKVQGGAVNGPIINQAGGQFDVNGPASSDSTFANRGKGTLLVADGGTYAVAGIIDNAGALRVRQGGTLTAAGIDNFKSGVITNDGTIRDALRNAGKVTNDGTYDATVASNSGTIVNEGTWMGAVASSTGTIVNGGRWTTTAGGFHTSGTLTTTGTLNAAKGGLINTGTVNARGTLDGPVANEAGVFTVTGALVGDSSFVNASGATLAVGADSYMGLTTVMNAGNVTLAGGGTLGATGSFDNAAAGTFTATGGTVLTPAFDNAGTVVASGRGLAFGSAAQGTTFNNSGTITMANGVAGDVTTINGAYNATGPNATLAVDVDFKTNPTSGARSDVLVINGPTSGNTRVDFSRSLTTSAFTVSPNLPTFVGGTLINPTPVIVSNGGGTFTPSGGQSTFATNGGLVQYALREVSPGNYDVVSGVNTGGVTPIATALSSAFGAITTNFFQSSSAFVTPGPNNAPDTLTGGPWIRVSGGSTTIDATGRDSLLNETVRSRTDTTFSGFQAGVDSGIMNFRGSQTNYHLGVTTGVVSAQTSEKLATSTQVDFNLPFVGVYGALKHDNIAADLTYRHDFTDIKVTNGSVLANTTRINGNGDSVYGNLLYAIGMYGYQIVPSLGLGFSHYDIDRLGTLLNASIAFKDIDSILGRAGIQVGKSFNIDRYVVQPFVTGAVWHEFAGDTLARFTDPSGLSDDVRTTRVGTFGQVGVGVSAQILPAGFTSFARGDFRFGDKLNGATGTLGLRYSF